MNGVERTKDSGETKAVIDGGTAGSTRGSGRMRRLTVGVLLAVGLATSGCTPGEIEASISRIALGFEQGGVERGLADAIFVAEYAIPVIGMRLGSALGP